MLINTYTKPYTKARMLSSFILLYISSLCLVSLALSCSESVDPFVNARRVTTRIDLVGGPSALGELGDFVMENSKIKVIIQDQGYSRGFGVYGGGLIDADFSRPQEVGNSGGVVGRDSFGELFPIYFLQALEPTQVEIVKDGAEGEAQVLVSGKGGDFLSLTKLLNRLLVNSYEGIEALTLADLLDPEKLAALITDEPSLKFEILYRLAPNQNYVIIESAMQNLTDEILYLPSQAAKTIFKSLSGFLKTRDPFEVPLGLVALFGAGNKVFAPGHGFDIRFSLEDTYDLASQAANEKKSAQEAGTPLTPQEDKTLDLPALPGLLTPGLISVSPEGCSYGIFYLPEEINGEYPKSFAYNLMDSAPEGEQKNVYEKLYQQEVGVGDALIPFSASSFTGMFYGKAPSQLDAQERFSVQTAFIIGDGDVSSVMDHYYELRDIEVAPVVGDVLDQATGSAVAHASILFYDAKGRIMNQSLSHENGQFKLTLPPGDYQVRVEQDPILGPMRTLTVRADGANMRLIKESPARLHVHIKGEDQAPLPAKVTVVGTAPADRAGEDLRTYLFDLSAGQRWRVSDLIPDNPSEPETLRYIETHGYTKNGGVSLDVPAGEYFVYLSRGTEYELKVIKVQLKAGEDKSLRETLLREIQTPKYISADFHLHAQPSLDSDLSLRHRVRSAAGEGLEHLVATDHNFVTDYQPTIVREGLQLWLSSMIGLELTTLEAGHFNVFPLERDVSKITRGAFQWSNRTPLELFNKTNEISDGEAIIQVNHPRDLILGYFSQYDIDPLKIDSVEAGVSVNPLTSLIAPSGRAFFDEEGNSQYNSEFHAIEVLNHGLFHEEFHLRMPDDERLRDILPDNLKEIPTGAIVCDGNAVAYAGVIDDWFNMLNTGERYTGTANSDSHHDDDIGYPRSYVYVDQDEPMQVDAQDVAQAVRQHQLTLSRGPFLEMFINGEKIGSDIVSDQTLNVRIKVQAASWIEVNQGTLFANGEAIEQFDIQFNENSNVFEWEKEVTVDRDTWFVAYVKGDQSMFPVAAPIDVPPVLLNEVFGSIAAPLGFGGDTLGALTPTMMGVFKPLALTNPIWVVSLI